jgi:hypothetical protein
MAQGSLTAPSETSVASGPRGKLRAILAGSFVVSLFLFFTWRGLLVYYTGDDLMNLYGYWSKPLSALIKANFFYWSPYYRPFGGLVYRSVFSMFGFNPYPLYVVFYSALLVNLLLMYRVTARIGGSREIGAIAALLFAYHGKFDYLYYNAGTLYDVFCFLFVSSALLIYLRARQSARMLSFREGLAFVVLLICGLNSKEMAVTLPVIVLLYELLFHAPDFGDLRALIRWVFREGRFALIGAACVLVYLPGKLSKEGLTATAEYVPHYNWDQYMLTTGTYLAELFYHLNRSTRLGVIPYSPAAIAAIFAVLIAIAALMRSRTMWFGLLFFVVALLPVSFVTPRGGFVLYMPLMGFALYVATFAAGVRDWLRAQMPALRAVSADAASVGLFVVMAMGITAIDAKHWIKAPNPAFSPYKITSLEIPRLFPMLPHGSKFLFVRTPIDFDWSMVFIMRLYYRDLTLEVTQLNGPEAQRIPLERLGRYDHILNFEEGHYVELDNADAYRSVKQDLRKASNPSMALGEAFTIGHPGAGQYLLSGIQVGPPDQAGYWTLDDPQLRFRLSSTKHNFFIERYFLPKETLQKTGPLRVDVYVNGHYLEQALLTDQGVYQHDVPESWLTSAEITTVRMHFLNPYVAPPYNDKLGVVLLSASFNPAVAEH